MKAGLLALSLLAIGPAAHAAVSGCTTAADYIATLEFLRERQELIPEAEARKLADRVAQGCSGSAQRFVRVFQLLSRAGLGGENAAAEAVKFATKTDRETETFITVFQKAYLREFLDLDLQSSLNLARSLSIEFEGDVLAVRSDFEKIIEYCVGAQRLDLPRPECGALAARLARRGQNHSGGVAEDFIAVFEFATSAKNGPGVPTFQGLATAEKIISAGPGAGQNFISAYRYAVSPKGLKMAASQALAFATDLALRTTR